MKCSSNLESSCDVKVLNEMGIHARPSAMIVRIANSYKDSDLYISKDGEQINGKSIMGLMMLAAGKGSKLTLTATGKNGSNMLRDLKDIFNRSFEET